MKKLIWLTILGLAAVFWLAPDCSAQATTIPIPKINIGVSQARGPQEVALSLQILFLMTVLSLAPSLLILTTCFTRIVVVLSFLRNALGTQQMPPNQVLVGFSLFLTFLVMSPVFAEINKDALQPYLKSKISLQTAYKTGVAPLRKFMFKQTREKDLSLIIHVAKIARPKNQEDVPTFVLIPAFAMSEFKTAFQIGFAVFIPFLIIDMVISSTLMSMGMLMLPPMMISLPFKILLFVLVDGWHLVVKSLLLSFK
ncbi:MAG: flagellar type III secretion system pore protein FliP [Armatimonadetes bacterium]|nr:flagellar type III secretion system pore protein FliP [Armatimonadota bacterium]